MSVDSAAAPDLTEEPAAVASDTARGRRVAVRSLDTVLFPVVTLVGSLLLWEVAVVVFNIKPYILPRPTSVLETSIEQLPYLIRHAIPTIQEILLGFGLSIVIGIPLAVAMVASRVFEKSIYPLLVASQTVPKVALAPLFVVWFGFGIEGKVLITFLIAFFPIVIDTAVGLRSVPVEMVDLAHSMGASRTSLFLKIRFPWALPNIFGGLKVGITLAVIGAVVGEFTGADQGLGYVLQRASGLLSTDLLFAAILVLVIVGIVSFLIVDVIERLAIPWHVSARREGAEH